MSALTPKKLIPLALTFAVLALPALAFDTNGTVTASKPSAPGEQRTLEGSVTISVPYTLTNCISELMETAEKKSEDYTRFQSAVEHYDTSGRKIADRTADSLNYTLMFRGITPSSEAGDIILGEKDKLKSLASAKYLRQKTEDDLRLRVTSDLMQLAMALGLSDQQESDRQVQLGEDDLIKLVGKEQAEKSIVLLKAMRDHETDQAKPGETVGWTSSETQERIQAAVQSAAQVDPIVKDIESDVHHFNQHSNAVLFGHRLVRVALSAISLAPNVIGPAAQVVLFGYLVVSGGPEQDKVLKELYLDKRLSSREHLLREQAHLALENYQLASLSNNKLLKSCSEQLVSQMTDATTASKLLNGSSVDLQAMAPK